MKIQFNYSKLHEIIRTRRKELMMKTGIAPQQQHQWLNGSRPNIRNLIRICNTLDIPWADFAEEVTADKEGMTA